MKQKCHHCGEEKENCYNGFIAMTLPIPEFEEQLEKLGRSDWWKRLEEITDIESDEFKKLDNLGMYDQLLNTVGRGVQCDDCAIKEEELYNKYYPKKLN
jgi:hypothetical protein